MGLAVVLLVYAIVLTAASAVGAVVLIAATKRYVRNAPLATRKPLVVAGFLPFSCVLFASVWFVGYAAISDLVFHHDPAIGDGWYTPVGNGYAIDMIDVTDYGVLHPAGDLNGSGAIDGVRRLQIIDDQVYGTQDTKASQSVEGREQREDKFFYIDLRTHQRGDFKDEAALSAYAATHGARLDLKPIAQVYEQFRWVWFDYLAGVILVSIPIAGLASFVLYLRRFRQVRV